MGSMLPYIAAPWIRHGILETMVFAREIPLIYRYHLYNL